jgi:aspartate/methionine/tyrosine aminotransferase
VILEPGDEVLIERPAYGLLLDAALYLEASVKRFERTEESGYALDPAAIRRAVSARTRLIVVTNLHNPSSALTSDTVLREIGDIARSVGAQVLVDEVYLDAVYQDTPRSAFHLGPEFLTTSSLTKVYGLSGLRAGWILAHPELARRMLALNNLYGATPAHPTELLAVAAFEKLAGIRDRARRVVEADRIVLREFLAGHSEFSAPLTVWGTTSFMRFLPGDADRFLARLRSEYETSAVPGRYFEMPDHIRVGMGVNSEMFAEGLRRIGYALNGKPVLATNEHK